MNSRTVLFYGASGSGKGTQAQLLKACIEKQDAENGVIYIETGQRFREFIQGDGYTNGLVKDVLESGGLLPEFLPIWIWTDFLIHSYTGKEHMILDGLSRRVAEAPVLHSALAFYKRPQPDVVILNTGLEWAKEKLLSRGRADDNHSDIDARLEWYEKNVVPTIEYFRKNSFFKCHDINGEQTIEQVHADIVKALGLNS